MTLVKWTTPKVVRRHKWQTEYKPGLLQMFGYLAKWIPLICTPALWAVGQYAPSELHRVVISVLCIPVTLALHTVPHLVLIALIGRESRLDNEGLRYEFGGNRHLIRWRQIEAWIIEDHPRIAGIRVLAIKAVILRRTRTRRFSFNPRTTDEACLRQILRLRVPTQ